MFDFCLAPDTNGDGTGCDNMTCVIVVFKDTSAWPHATNKRKAETDADAVENESETKRPRKDPAS